MVFPLVPIILGGGLVVSGITNIIQGKQIRKLRKQIEKLEKIIRNLTNDIKELKKELKTLKIWFIKKRLELENQIKTKERERAEKTLSKEALERQLDN